MSIRDFFLGIADTSGISGAVSAWSDSRSGVISELGMSMMQDEEISEELDERIFGDPPQKSLTK